MGRGLSALVVERQATVAAVVVKVLRRAGFARAPVIPDVTAIGLDALYGFDVVLADVYQRAKNPAAFARFSRAAGERGAVVGVMATSTERLPDATRIDETCRFVLIKPFTPAVLRQTLREHGLSLPAPEAAGAPAAALSAARDTETVFL